MMASHFLRNVRQHLNQSFGEQWIGRAEAESTGLHDLLTSILWIYMAAGTPKDFGVFSAITDLRGIRATSREYLSGDSNETRNFRQSAHFCAPKN
jgi:hypothetical protein